MSERRALFVSEANNAEIGGEHFVARRPQEIIARPRDHRWDDDGDPQPLEPALGARVTARVACIPARAQA